MYFCFDHDNNLVSLKQINVEIKHDIQLFSIYMQYRTIYSEWLRSDVFQSTDWTLKQHLFDKFCGMHVVVA